MLSSMCMMKRVGLFLAATASLAWAAEEVPTYAEGSARVGEDGWVLLCYGADWDNTHDERWLRRQSAISSACGNALILYVPVYQNPTEKERQQLASILGRLAPDRENLRSVPCAVLLDAEGFPYASISGDDFLERAPGLIRQKQAQLRTRCSLMRQAAREQGLVKAQTLGSIYRLGIAPPPGLRTMLAEADPEDRSGMAGRADFDPWQLAERLSKLSWEESLAELENAGRLQLSQEERQTLLAVRMGCVHRHLAAAGARDIRRLANECVALAPGTPLARAAERAGELWGKGLELTSGWKSGQLPRVAAACAMEGMFHFNKAGEYRIEFTPRGGKDALRINSVILYDGNAKICEDNHSCIQRADQPMKNNIYMLLVRQPLSHPCLVVTFDQQGKTDTHGTISMRYFNEDGVEEGATDQTRKAMDEAHLNLSTPAERRRMQRRGN